MTSHDKGMQAFRAGQPETANPFHPLLNEIEFAGWVDGYRFARSIAR